jgi:hypothetical protein
VPEATSPGRIQLVAGDDGARAGGLLRDGKVAQSTFSSTRSGTASVPPASGREVENPMKASLSFVLPFPSREMSIQRGFRTPEAVWSDQVSQSYLSRAALGQFGNGAVLQKSSIAASLLIARAPNSWSKGTIWRRGTSFRAAAD